MILPIPGCDGYFISSDGRVFLRSSGEEKEIAKHLAGGAPGKRYWYGGIRLNGKSTNVGIHRLLLISFKGPRPNGMEVRHINGISTDNRLENLEWTTHKDNIADRRVHGTENIGERNGQAKIGYDKVVLIRELYSTGKFSHESLSKRFGISRRQVGRIVNRERWKIPTTIHSPTPAT